MSIAERQKRNLPRWRAKAAAKRAIDIIFSLIMMTMMLPVMLLVACAIRMCLGSPVLFRQARPGLHGKPFIMFKFRTMRTAFDAQGRPLPDRERLGALGRWLRATSLDELPELWNVLVGDMSLVGPRPLLVHYLPLYTPEQARRHEVRPGITGWAQVNGRNAISWKQKLEYDVWYVDHWTLWLDLRILCLTVVKTFSAAGINKDGHATTDEFRGDER